MTQEDKDQLKLEISHIFESGVSEMRIFEMVVNLLNSGIRNSAGYTTGYREGWRDCCKDVKEFGN